MKEILINIIKDTFNKRYMIGVGVLIIASIVTREIFGWTYKNDEWKIVLFLAIGAIILQFVCPIKTEDKNV